MELTPGGTLGRYRLLDRAGAGGMAEVWRAVQPGLDRIVAIKVLPRHLASEPGYLERFQREARAISRLEHQHILGIYDYGEDDGYTYMVMPFLAGGTLSRNMGRPWAVPAAVRILEPLASALDFAHARGIVHRDVKPSNVLVGEDGRIVLGDFGIARMTEGTLAVSAVGSMVGTPAYMSPEQVQGIPVSAASDQYALGIMTYEMLTGRVPFSAETPLAVAVAHLHRPLPPPRTINPDISPAAEQVLFKALAKQPADRYPTVTAFVEALAAAGRQPAPHPAATYENRPLDTGSPHAWSVPPPMPLVHSVPAAPPPNAPPTGNTVRRYGLIVAVGALITVVGVIGGSLLGGGGTPARATPTPRVAAQGLTATPPALSTVTVPPPSATAVAAAALPPSPTSPPPPTQIPAPPPTLTSTPVPPTATPVPPATNTPVPPPPVPKPATIDTSAWQTYDNRRYGFSIRYPEAWPRSAESRNGDGASLYVGNPDAQITAYGNLAPANRQDPFELAKKPGFQRNTIKLDNGQEGDLIVGREDNQVVYQLVAVKGDVAFYFYAKTTEEFYRQNQAILLQIAKSLTPG